MTGILELPEEDAKKSARKLEEALENYAAGKYNNAVANCLTALRLYRTNATEIYFVMGLAHLELGTLATEWDINDTIVACENFSVVISRAPECAAAYYYPGRRFCAGEIITGGRWRILKKFWSLSRKMLRRVSTVKFVGNSWNKKIPDLSQGFGIRESFCELFGGGFVIILDGGFDSLFRQNGAVQFVSGQTVQRLGNGFVRELKNFFERLALNQFGRHGTRGDSRAAAESFKFGVSDHAVVDFQIHFHDVAAFGVADLPDAVRVLDTADVARVAEMIHNFFAVKCHVNHLSPAK